MRFVDRVVSFVSNGKEIELDTNIPLKKREIDTRKEFLICLRTRSTYDLHILQYTFHLMRNDFHETMFRP